MQLRRYRFRRGLVRASRVIAVSEATHRDVENLMGCPGERAPGLQRARPRVSGAPRRVRRPREVAHTGALPDQLSVSAVRRQHPATKNVPRLVEAFAVVREQLSAHPVYKDLRLVIIGDTISQYPSVRQAVIKSRVESVVRFLGFVPFETLRCFYESAAAFVFRFPVRRIRPAAAGGHGVRHAGGHFQRELAAGGGGRLRPCW